MAQGFGFANIPGSTVQGILKLGFFRSWTVGLWGDGAVVEVRDAKMH